MSGGPPRQLIAHRSSHTGDTLHVAGALALDSSIDVIVVHVGSIGTTEGLLNFYRQATDPTYPDAAISPESAATNKRVKVIYALNEDVAKALYKALSSVEASDVSVKTEFPEILSRGSLLSETPRVGVMPAALKQIQDFAEFKANYLDANYQYMGNIGRTTLAIAEKFENAPTAVEKKALHTELAKKLTARSLDSADIIKGTSQVPLFGQQNLPDATSNKSPIVLLWARYTGTNTANAHNPGGDSCVQGQKQINNVLTSLNCNVITIGHGPRGAPPFRTQFDVGEFYKQDPITSDRATQLSFFLALMEKYPGRLYQIGQKTGGMDGAALLGIPTIYLEPKGSAAIKRMEKWSDGALPFYHSVIIDQPAPAIVRVLQIYSSGKDGWRASSKPMPEARARLAAMVFVYPTQMGMDGTNGTDQCLPTQLPSKPSSITTEEKEKLWKARVIKDEKNHRFTRIVEWAEDQDVHENENNPALDGFWTKEVQCVSQSDLLGPGAAGYSDEDLGKIREEMEKLIQTYSTDNAAVLRM